MTELTKVPARIIIQIREGKARLAEFDLEVAAEGGEVLPGAKLLHEVPVPRLIEGLAKAMSEQVKTLYEVVGHDEEKWGSVERWLHETMDWIVLTATRGGGEVLPARAHEVPTTEEPK